MKKNKKHVLILVGFFVCFFLLTAKRGVINAISDCSLRHNCPEEDYPYCIPNINFNDCTGVYKCWDGDILGDLDDGDCTYRYDPNPPADATPWPTPTIDVSGLCQISPTSVEHNYYGYVSIRNANIETDQKYYVTIETSSDSVSGGPYTPQEKGLIKILFPANDPLQESATIMVKRASIGENFVCSGGIYVEEKENDDDNDDDGDQEIVDICRGDKDCLGCLDREGSWTALGCIPTDPRELVKWIFPFLLGLGGLSAFALIVFSGIQILTSGGNPEKIQGAKETITSAVTGLLFIILSLFLLRLIGGNILDLPGFLGN